MKKQIEYIFECGCRSKEFIIDYIKQVKPKKGTKTKLCPDHKKPIKFKMRQCHWKKCSNPKEWHETSKKSNSKIWICPICQDDHKLELAKRARDRNKKTGKISLSRFRIKRREPNRFNSCGYEYDSMAVRILEEKFPTLPKYEMSKECLDVIKKYAASPA